MEPADENDEMFRGVAAFNEEVGGASELLKDLRAIGKVVHADFFNDFGDLCDDHDLN